MLVPDRSASRASLVVIVSAALALGGCGDDDASKPAPSPGAKAAEDLGFPAFATKNTTRVGGTDGIADAAAVALATYPSSTAAGRPLAVAVADSERWQEALAATSLMAPPLGAPTLLTKGDEIPETTRRTFAALAPRGTDRLRGARAIRLGKAPVPGGAKALPLGGATPPEVAAAVDELRAKLRGRRSRNVMVVSSKDPSHGMAAAGWAARSGDPILFSDRDSIPAATRSALARHPKNTRVYVIGPAEGVSSRAVRALDRLPRVGRVRRITGATPAETSVVFARYLDGTFGWDVNDPGHGFAVARETRPLDAVAAAPLSATGKFGPLLISDRRARLPEALRAFLLDLQPGYRDDPVRAVYNHVWVLGDLDSISAAQQAEIDRLAEITKIEVRQAPRRRAKPPPPRRARPGGSVPTDEEVQETLEDLLDASPDRGGDADR